MLSPKTIAVGVVVLGLIGGGVWLGTRGTPTEAPTPDSGPNGDDSAVGTQVQDLLAKTSNITGLHYNLTVNNPDGEYKAEVWQEYGAPNMRVEGSFEGQSGVAIFTEASGILYMPDQDMAVKVNKAQARQYTENSAKSQTQKVEDHLAAISVQGSETFDGKDCLVITYPDGERTIKMWVWKKYGIPLKTVVPEEDGQSVAELTNVEVKNIPASMFQLPEGVQVQEMPNIPSGDQIPENIPENIPDF